ncbi:hypothetical protein BDR04DRAFT_1095349 [Suillus decipiens]|nr:hypothetical protein BDR04DRAFT_1095349 [Suillus decipiens]
MGNPIIVHAGTCTKQKRCEENWKELWWNRMNIFNLTRRLSNTSRNSTSERSTQTTGGPCYVL